MHVQQIVLPRATYWELKKCRVAQPNSSEMDGDENDMIPVKDMTEKERPTRGMYHDKGNGFIGFEQQMTFSLFLYQLSHTIL